jgi:large subunit ribosomal protein L25
MKFVAYERTLQGTGASRRLRNASKVPGIVYGAGTPSMIELDHNALFFALKKEAFHSSLLDMELGGKTQKVLLRDFQMHAYKPLVLHIDFQRVDEKTKIRKKVPLHYKNEEASAAVKTDKCLVSHITTEIDIECLAAQLPEFIEVDLSVLTKGQSLHGKDLKLPAGVKLMLRGKKDVTLVTANPPKAEVEEAAPATPVVAAGADKAAPKKKDERQNKK